MDSADENDKFCGTLTRVVETIVIARGANSTSATKPSINAPRARAGYTIIAFIAISFQ